MSVPPRWTDGMIIELVGFYQENPVLWNTKNVNYRNKKIKDQLYQNISQKLAVSIDEVKKKFCNLRSQFSKEQAKVVASCNSATSPNDVYIPGWHFYRQLSFLRDGPEYKECPANVEVVYSSFNLDEDHSFKEEPQDNEQLDSESSSSLVEQPQQPPPTPPPSYAHTHTRRRHKRKNEEADTTSSNKMAKIEPRRNASLQMDSNESFGVFVARELDTIEDCGLVDEIKFRIHELLFKAKRSAC